MRAVDTGDLEATLTAVARIRLDNATSDTALQLLRILDGLIRFLLDGGQYALAALTALREHLTETNGHSAHPELPVRSATSCSAQPR